MGLHADIAAGAGLRAVHPAATLLPGFSAARRVPLRPVAMQEAGFSDRYDFETLFYDAFWSHDGHIVLLGPPFLNLRSALAEAKIIALPSGAICAFEVREMDRHGQLHVAAPAGTTTLRLEASFGETAITVQTGETDVFAGRRVMFTQSKDNRLEWIADWARFGRDLHGADAMLVYDNGSSAYRPEEIAETLLRLEGIVAVRVVDWPFKFGPQGGGDKQTWDSDFGQHGVWEHARRRFLHKAASVQGSDVDEFVMSPRGESIFAAVEADPFGVLRYRGRWVMGIEGRDPAPGMPERRHKDYGVTRLDLSQRLLGVTLRRDPELCPPKWSVVPAKTPERAQWRIHAIGDQLAARRMTNRFSYRHFREISNSWKYERSGREPFDAARFEVDEVLARQMDRVRWDR